MALRLKNVVTVFRKEVLDIIRDRRTLFSMIIVPMLMFPLLTTGIGSFTSKQVQKMAAKQAPVILIGAERFPELKTALQNTERIQLIDNVLDTTSALPLLRDETVRVVIELPQSWNASLAQNGTLPFDSIRVYYVSAKDESEMALKRVERALSGARDAYAVASLERAGLPGTLIKPFSITRVDRTTPSELGGKIIGMFLPYMLILLSLTGAMYPAIDLTAGEKERGTLETLLLSPASRSEIVAGKFLTVMMASLITSVLTLTSILLSSNGLLMSIPKHVQDSLNLQISPIALLSLVALMIPLAATFAALLMAIALQAKSYKEAQSYISPLMIVAILPAMGSLIPGVQTDWVFALIPILNVSLLIKDAFAGTLEFQYLLAAAGSTILLSIIAIRICVMTFKKESVLFRV